MILKNQFREIESLPTPSRLKFLGIEEKFDALKSAEQIFSDLSDNYDSPIADIKTPEAYREYLASNQVAAHDEMIRARDVMRNTGLLKDFAGRFGMLPKDLNGESQMHLRESLEAAILQMKTGLSSTVSMNPDAKQGMLSISKGDTTMNVPFYVAYGKGEAFDVDDNPIGIEIGPMQISPDLQSKFPRLSRALSDIVIAKTSGEIGLVIEDDFTLQAHEVDDMLFLNHLSQDKNAVSEVTRYLDKQNLQRDVSKDTDYEQSHSLGY